MAVDSHETPSVLDVGTSVGGYKDTLIDGFVSPSTSVAPMFPFMKILPLGMILVKSSVLMIMRFKEENMILYRILGLCSAWLPFTDYISLSTTRLGEVWLFNFLGTLWL